jgi:hypothetical protein
MAPGQEIAIRALGTALAGLSLATAIHMLAYGGGKMRVNNAEYLAIFAEPRGRAGEASPVKPPAQPVIDMATTGSLPAVAGKPALHSRPAEIVAARADRIVARNGGWVLLDDNGATLLTVASSANGAGRQAALAAARSAP